MSQEPEKRSFMYENFILAWTRLSNIRKIVRRLMDRKVYKDLPSTVKDDINEVKDIAEGRPKEE